MDCLNIINFKVMSQPVFSRWPPVKTLSWCFFIY